MTPPAARAPRVLLLSTEPGSGSGAYRLLEYFLDAAHPWRDQLLVVAPENSDVFAAALRSDIPHQPWPASRDSLSRHLLAGLTLPVPPGIDVVHAWHTRGFEPALLLGRRLGAAVSATLHDHPEEGLHGRSRLRLMRFSARRMKSLVSVGEALAQAWAPFAGRAAVRVIRNGIPDAGVPARSNSKRVRIGFAGLYSPEAKGWRVLKDWIPASLRGNWPVEWRLFGLKDRDSAVEAEIRRIVADAPEGFVRFAGFTSTEVIFRDIDLLVHPSLVFDSFPTLLLEAARAGLPVFCSDAGGSAEIVLDGETGIVFPRHSAIEAAPRLRALVEDGAARARMGAAARRSYETRHRSSLMVSAYLSFWRGGSRGADLDAQK